MGGSSRWFAWLSFVAGFSVMAAEMGAARLLAPYVGTSTSVWALLIGAVMASLAIGNLMGGRLASRPGALRIWLGTLIAAGVVLLAMPVLGRFLLAESLHWFKSGSFSAILVSTGAVLALLALPITSLGMASPLLIHHAIDAPERAGALAGKLYAAGTMGSLLGTYVSGIVLVPLVGTSRTFWFCGTILILQGSLGLLRAARWKSVTVSAALLTLLLPRPTVKPHNEMVFETESAHNYIQVRDHAGMRRLYVNDGFAHQSIYPLDGSPPQEGVWQHYAQAPAWTTHAQPRRMLMIGLGAGAAARAWRVHYPRAQIVGIEIDPEIAKVGQRWMGLPLDMEVRIGDARPTLASDPQSYDVILADAFRFPYVPFQLTTVEFMSELNRHLTPGGVVVLNVGRNGPSREVADAIGRTAQEVFSRVSAIQVGAFNTLFVLTQHGPELDAGLDAISVGPEPTAPRKHRSLQRWHAPETAPVLTDDLAPVEWLTDRTVLDTVMKRWLPNT